MLYRISVAERGLTGIANIFRSRLSGLDDLLRAGTVPLRVRLARFSPISKAKHKQTDTHKHRGLFFSEMAIFGLCFSEI